MELPEVGGAVALEPLLQRVFQDWPLSSGVEPFSGDDQNVVQAVRMARFHEVLHNPDRFCLRLAVQVNGFVGMLG